MSETNSELIDVRQLMRELSVEELCRTAELFFAQQLDSENLLAKPLSDIIESPDLLISFAHVIRGLNLLPDMTVLDFGAGSCWTTHFLTQLGLRAIAVDVSPSALRIGHELFRRRPIFGNRPAPRFLLFDGTTIDLPDQTVDRITCWDAFHHVPNPEQVLREFGRVLKTDGIAGFAEPGPNHSQTAQAQYEMKTNRVIENDINVNEIWQAAQSAGFAEIKLTVFNAEPVYVSLTEFEDYLNGGAANEKFIRETRRQLVERRIFFLSKSGPFAPMDSRQKIGLQAELRVTTETRCASAESNLAIHIFARNTGRAKWLATPEPPESRQQADSEDQKIRIGRQGPDQIPPRVGAVRFGIQLDTAGGGLLETDYFRCHLTPGDGREILPGSEVEFSTLVRLPKPGRYILHCDLVSECVSWFDHVAPTAQRIEIEVT